VPIRNDQSLIRCIRQQPSVSRWCLTFTLLSLFICCCAALRPLPFPLLLLLLFRLVVSITTLRPLFFFKPSRTGSFYFQFRLHNFPYFLGLDNRVVHSFRVDCPFLPQCLDSQHPFQNAEIHSIYSVMKIHHLSQLGRLCLMTL
jgi:hypothetical protein